MFYIDLRNTQRTFTAEYRSFSAATLWRNEIPNFEMGNRVILPKSLSQLNFREYPRFPTQFKITNPRSGRDTHGVLYCMTDGDGCYLPDRMMKHLCLDEGDHVLVESIQLQKGEFAKFQPLSVDFLKITDPRAALLNSLQDFFCLSVNDTIVINFNDKQYELSVLETRPGRAIDIRTCNLYIDIAAPADHVPGPEEISDCPTVSSPDLGPSLLARPNPAIIRPQPVAVVRPLPRSSSGTSMRSDRSSSSSRRRNCAKLWQDRLKVKEAEWKKREEELMRKKCDLERRIVAIESSYRASMVEALELKSQEPVVETQMKIPFRIRKRGNVGRKIGSDVPPWRSSSMARWSLVQVRTFLDQFEAMPCSVVDTLSRSDRLLDLHGRLSNGSSSHNAYSNIATSGRFRITITSRALRRNERNESGSGDEREIRDLNDIKTARGPTKTCTYTNKRINIVFTVKDA